MLEPGGGVQAIIFHQHRVQLRMLALQFDRQVEEGLADDREKLGRVAGAVGIDQRVFQAAVGLTAQTLVFTDP